MEQPVREEQLRIILNWFKKKRHRCMQIITQPKEEIPKEFLMPAIRLQIQDMLPIDIQEGEIQSLCQNIRISLPG